MVDIASNNTMMERLHPTDLNTRPVPPASLPNTPSPGVTPSPAKTPTSTSRRPSDSGMETAAKTVVFFPGSGTLAAATLGALGSVAAIATGSVALIGVGAAACAFKFSPSLNKESRQQSRQEEAKVLAQANQDSETKRVENLRKQEDDSLATVLSARENHR